MNDFMSEIFSQALMSRLIVNLSFKTYLNLFPWVEPGTNYGFYANEYYNLLVIRTLRAIFYFNCEHFELLIG